MVLAGGIGMRLHRITKGGANSCSPSQILNIKEQISDIGIWEIGRSGGEAASPDFLLVG